MRKNGGLITEKNLRYRQLNFFEISKKIQLREKEARAGEDLNINARVFYFISSVRIFLD